MRKKDKDLGLDARITRRDLIHGLGVIAGGSLVPGKALADAALRLEAPKLPYPPALTGLRGNHTGSWEVAHAVAREGLRGWPAAARQDDSDYDLVIVGGGISGLSAAHFWLKSQPDAKILILDNHDDFGGHAKRNEFTVGGSTLIGYGGSQTLQEPSSYPAVAKELLDDLGIVPQRFDKAYDKGFYRRHGLAAGIFFGEQAWGSNTLVSCNIGEMYEDYLPLATAPGTLAESVGRMPLTPAARQQLIDLLSLSETRIPGASEDERYAYLETISYREFLSRHMDVTEPTLFQFFQDMPYDFGAGIESVTADWAIFYSGLPGAAVTGISSEEVEPYIHHFPDGNASVARLLVQRLIPAVAPGSGMDDVVTASFDYSVLDLPSNPVRLRLNSTVTLVTHEGAPATAKKVAITYVTDGEARTVRAGKCIMACYNAMIPGLCPELPAQQREALAQQVKVPILYTSVALRNWKAWKALGVGAVLAPGSYHINAMLDFPVSMGDYHYSSGPDQPVIAHLERFPHRANEGLTRREQYRAGRHELLSTPYKTIERNVREQLTGMLAPGGFDPARDITGITVNRWAHGYSYGMSPSEYLSDDRDDERHAHVRARRPFGRIAIANCDAGARAMMEEAVVQARRAVDELS